MKAFDPCDLDLCTVPLCLPCVCLQSLRDTITGNLWEDLNPALPSIFFLKLGSPSVYLDHSCPPWKYPRPPLASWKVRATKLKQKLTPNKDGGWRDTCNIMGLRDAAFYSPCKQEAEEEILFTLWSRYSKLISQSIIAFKKITQWFSVVFSFSRRIHV